METYVRQSSKHDVRKKLHYAIIQLASGLAEFHIVVSFAYSSFICNSPPPTVKCN